MYYQQVAEDNNTRSMISAWLGYNHNYRIADGEFYDMQNMSSDGYPVLVPRQKRISLTGKRTKEIDGKTVNVIENIKGFLFTEDKLAYIDTDTFYYGNDSVYIGDVDEEQTLVRFGTYILIYPLNIYIDTQDMSVGLMAAGYESAAGVNITVGISDEDGSPYEGIVYQETAPSSPNDGDLWVCTLKTSLGLNMYNKALSTWQPVATCYLKITLPVSEGGTPIDEIFSYGDAVYLNLMQDAFEGLDVDTINNGSIVQAVGRDYIVVLGIMDSPLISYRTGSVPVKAERRIPKLDYVCSAKNRMWGCRYGFQDGKFVNEIYCTKLGDFKNWYAYQGLSTDSYSASVGVPGEWTGCISYQGYPTFFKEDSIFRIFGNMPSEYQISQIDARGVQKGSSRSLAIVGEYVYYKAAGGCVMVWDGSYPSMISPQLGKNRYYYDGVAGVCDGKYHLVVKNRQNAISYFVYDSQNGIWTKEDPKDVRFFSWSLDGQLYAATKDEILGLGSTDNIEYANKTISEEFVKWYAQTGDFGYEYPDFKYVSKITIRAFIPYESELKVMISYDDRPFEDVGILRGNDDIMSQCLTITPYRCDRYRIRFEGHGAVRIYTMATTLEAGSEEYGHTY